MALVPFRVAGAAADQSLETRLFQVGGHALSIRQNPRGSGALRTLQPAGGPKGAPFVWVWVAALLCCHARCSLPTGGRV